MKFMQNSKGWTKFKMKDAKVVTTMTSVNIYVSGRLVGSAGVKNPKDFNYNALLAFAKHQSGSKIQVV